LLKHLQLASAIECDITFEHHPMYNLWLCSSSGKINWYPVHACNQHPAPKNFVFEHWGLNKGIKTFTHIKNVCSSSAKIWEIGKNLLVRHWLSLKIQNNATLCTKLHKTLIKTKKSQSNLCTFPISLHSTRSVSSSTALWHSHALGFNYKNTVVVLIIRFLGSHRW